MIWTIGWSLVDHLSQEASSGPPVRAENLLSEEHGNPEGTFVDAVQARDDAYSQLLKSWRFHIFLWPCLWGELFRKSLGLKSLGADLWVYYGRFYVRCVLLRCSIAVRYVRWWNSKPWDIYNHEVTYDVGLWWLVLWRCFWKVVAEDIIGCSGPMHYGLLRYLD